MRSSFIIDRSKSNKNQATRRYLKMGDNNIYSKDLTLSYGHLLPIGAAIEEKETMENNLKLAKEWLKDNRYQKQKDARTKEMVQIGKQKN